MGNSFPAASQPGLGRAKEIQKGGGDLVGQVAGLQAPAAPGKGQPRAFLPCQSAGAGERSRGAPTLVTELPPKAASRSSAAASRSPAWSQISSR